MRDTRSSCMRSDLCPCVTAVFDGIEDNDRTFCSRNPGLIREIVASSMVNRLIDDPELSCFHHSMEPLVEARPRSSESIRYLSCEMRSFCNDLEDLLVWDRWSSHPLISSIASIAALMKTAATCGTIALP